MKNLSLTISNLEKSTKDLIERYKLLKAENEMLRMDLEHLQNDVGKKDEEIAGLLDKNRILRIAGGSSKGDKREIKLKINELVREVDKCIAQLNK